jgi:hypothetical protein
MSIRFLAEELYRWTRTVEDLEKKMAQLTSPADMAERARLEMELLHAKKELAHIKAVLSAKKEKPLI